MQVEREIGRDREKVSARDRVKAERIKQLRERGGISVREIQSERGLVWTYVWVCERDTGLCLKEDTDLGEGGKFTSCV